MEENTKIITQRSLRHQISGSTYLRIQIEDKTRMEKARSTFTQLKNILCNMLLLFYCMKLTHLSSQKLPIDDSKHLIYGYRPMLRVS